MFYDFIVTLKQHMHVYKVPTMHQLDNLKKEVTRGTFTHLEPGSDHETFRFSP